MYYYDKYINSFASCYGNEFMYIVYQEILEGSNLTNLKIPLVEYKIFLWIIDKHITLSIGILEWSLTH